MINVATLVPKTAVIEAVVDFVLYLILLASF